MPWTLRLIALWCGVALVALLFAPHATPTSRVLAIVGLIALPVILGYAQRGATGRTAASSKRAARQRAKRDPLANLRRLRPSAADTVATAQGLLDGPLRDSKDVEGGKRAADALAASLRSLDEVYAASRQARQAATKLGQELTAAGQKPARDRLWAQTDRGARDLDKRARAMAAELEESSTQIIDGWADLEQVKARQQSARDMQQARNEAVDAADAAARVAAADGALELSRATLHDAVDAVSGRLDALADLEDLSDTLAPLRQPAIVGGSELAPAAPASAGRRRTRSSRRGLR